MWMMFLTADVSCDTVDMCHINAQCVFDDSTLKHVCVCSAGYQGDGLVCTPQGQLKHSNTYTLKDSYVTLVLVDSDTVVIAGLSQIKNAATVHPEKERRSCL